MSSPAISDCTSAQKSRPKNALEIAIRNCLAACRRSAGKGKTAGRARIKGGGDEREANRLQPVLALIIDCGTDASLGGRVGVFAEREGALAPVSARGL